MRAYDEITHLLATDTQDAATLAGSLRQLRGDIVSGGMMIGIVPVDAEDLLFRGWRHLAQIGTDEDRLFFSELAMHSGRHDVAPEAIDHVRRVVQTNPTARAHRLAGYMAHRGFGMAEDLSVAAASHRRAAELGDSGSMFELWIYYTDGLGVERDEVVARTWLDAAAKAGSPRANYNLGAELARTGDLAGAADYYQKAADLGSGQSAATLAAMLVNGDLPDDRERAQELVNRATETGFDVEDFFFQIGLELEDLGLQPYF